MLYSKGFLDDIPLPSIISLLAFTKTTGILRLENADKNLVTTLYFKQGIATFATTTCQDLRLSSLLLKADRMNLHTLRTTEKYLTPHKLHGQILMETGILIEKELYQTLKEQIKEVILSLFEWENGEFLFTQMDIKDMHRFDIEFEFPMHHLIILGIMRIDSFHRLMNILGGPDMPYVRVGGAPSSMPEKLMTKYEMLVQCFTEPTTIIEASRQMCDMKAMTFLRNVLVLLSFGLIEPVKVAADGEHEDTAEALVNTYSRLLQQLCSQLEDMSPVTMRLEIESALENTKKQFPFIKQRIRLDDTCSIPADFTSDLEMLPKPKQKEILLTFLHTFIENLMQNYKQQIGRELYINVVESMLQELMHAHY